MNLKYKILPQGSFRLVIILMITTSVMIFAQDSLQDSINAKINDMTDKLDKKLLLTDAQESNIRNILEEYFKGMHASSVQGTNTQELRLKSERKILNLLDKKQKMKFEIIKEDWWALAAN